MLYHCWLLSGAARLDGGVLRAVVSSGWVGVDVFFILSGFVHFLPVVRHHGDMGPWPAYAWRRIARVVPAYYLCLIVIIVLNRTIDWAALGAHMTFLQVPLFGLSTRTGMNADQPLWTLSIEAAFYVALPLVAVRFVRRPWWWLAGTLVVAETWKLVTESHGIRWAVQFPSFVGHFSLGMAAAWLYVRHRDRIARWSLVGQVVSLALFVALMAQLVDSDALRHFTRNLGFAAAFTALLLFTVTTRWTFSALPLRFFSQVSYGVYLFHILVIGRLFRYVRPDGSTAAFLKTAALTIPIASVIGWISLVVIETPVRDWARRRAQVRG